ncbi:MAG: cation:proton antiporter [Minicystis sp.]
MTSLTEHQLLLVLLGLTIILLVGRTLGEIARRLGQPEVLGELCAGFVLGPSVAGAIAPAAHRALFLDPTVGAVLSAFSWVGAVLLLVLAGAEVDLGILRERARPGALAAAGAVVPSLLAGLLFTRVVLHGSTASGVFLGIVLGVTAVSVVAKILIERGALRRSWAQVLLAGGVASEVVVWLLVALASATQSAAPVAAATRSAVSAVGFFLVVILLGRRATAWAMRRVADATHITKGPISLVLVLAFVAGAFTQALGLHALLGAFALGVLLGRAPRAGRPLFDALQTLTTGLFAPVFFVLAGMRVDVTELRTPAAWGTVALLLAVATIAKVVPATLGARLGGLPPVEAALVGVGLDVKGGTDVIVAILGVELGLLSPEIYTMYAVVAIVTGLASPPLLDRLAARAPPSTEEAARLEREEAERRAYVPRVERVLLPVVAPALSALPAPLLSALAASKHARGQTFDVTELRVGAREGDALDAIGEAAALANVELTRRTVDPRGAVHTILEAARDHDLVAVGARPPRKAHQLSFGHLQDAIIHRARSNVLVVVNAGDAPIVEAKRILVPIIGLEYSLAAADIAAHLALAWDADLVFFHTVLSDTAPLRWHERDHARLWHAAHGVVEEAAFRARRLGVRVDRLVRAGRHPRQEIVRELEGATYDLVVVGCYDHGTRGRVYLGSTVEALVTRSRTPAVLLVSRGAPWAV